MVEGALTLRRLYRLGELPGDNPLTAAQRDLDYAVRQAYGMTPAQDALSFLLDLNLELATAEDAGGSVRPPGPPDNMRDQASLISDDCIRPG
jgi:hypothetical protein